VACTHTRPIIAPADLDVGTSIEQQREEGTVYAPIARISNVLARHGVEIGRNPRWIEDADAEHIARVNDAVVALRQK
jgi:hypothetical protein